MGVSTAELGPCLDAATIGRFQKELGAMGYAFQFVTLAGFHSLNLGMFELARDYRDAGMAAYAKLQATPSWSVVGRYEYLDDTKGGFMTFDTKARTITVTSDHTIAGALKARLEYRTDFADEDIFEKDDGSFTGSQTTLTVGVVYSFGAGLF